ncbi:phosphotransferase [Starkeya koreensis]|uniref:Hydroxylysine kinase n=1 Tax=Ancylobacter koreensis TaxID=266121 RepID=A0ABT0DKE3_9HYPH|nr:phosphotransferase [Ancylobacter koreensis]MCK0207741.1 phosphotransferase [Ancylobacter koreensis]
MSDVLTDAPRADALATPSPSLTAGRIERIVRDEYGFEGRARLLTSERDQNFHFAVPGGEALVIKVTNPAEDRLVTDFQTRALLHIEERDPALPVPCLRRTLKGEAVFVLEEDGAGMVVRALSWLEGVPLYQVERTPRQRAALGAALARMGLALRDFRHPAAGHFLQWDIQHAAKLRPLLEHIEDPTRRALATEFLDRFDAEVAPVLPGLRRQIVHNDLNPFNVLVAADDHDRVTGIFDFGDMVETALVNDVAVACSYQLAPGDDPLAGVIDFAAAYCRVRPLDETELGLLFDLTAARMLTTVAVTNWRALRYPENRAYILRNSPSAWDGLQRFAVIGPERARARLVAACLGN